MTSIDTLKLLLPASLPMLPPTASISSAICSAVRFVVPLSSTRENSFVRPLSAAVSASRPPRNTASR